MSKSGKQPIQNAVEIIEKFGGIRPMSSKINVAVTTIQGWKKRNVIPAARKNIILDAATTHNIDLSAVLDGAPSIAPEVKDAPADVVEEAKEEVTEETSASERQMDDDRSANDAGDVVEIMSVRPVIEAEEEEATQPLEPAKQGSNFTEIAIETERRAISKSAAIAAGMVLVVLAIIVTMLWPDFKEFGQRENRLATLEGDLSDMKDSQSTFKGLVPENWSEQLSDLKQQIAQTKQVVDETVESVQEASQQFIEENNLEERAQQLQTYVSEIVNESGVYSLLSTRFEGMEDNYQGQQDLDDSVLELSAILESTRGKSEDYVNDVLASARSQSVALQQTLGNVPQDELKAAAMLLALTQVRSALNRNEEAFDNDFNLLMGMVGEDNVALRTSLTKLAPHSKSGVLSANGLQEEFRSVAGEAVAASLRGEDVSFSEKASARMNEILQIEKNDELISGTQTQATVNKAGKMMQGGNFDDALKFLKKKLNAKELKPLEPWIKKVEAVLAARKVKKAIEQAIDMNFGSGLLGGKQLLQEE